MKFFQEFIKGLWKEIPPFRLVLGLCPTLAVTDLCSKGTGMGLATTFVLVCSNILVSLLRNVIPSKVRIACYILIIATFVVIVEHLLQVISFDLYQKLGLFIPLIVVNCIVLGRAEAFAAKNGIGLSIADGLGIGIGFTLALSTLGALREIFSAGTISLFAGQVTYVFTVLPETFKPFLFAKEAPGAFVFLGIMLALMNLVSKK